MKVVFSALALAELDEVLTRLSTNNPQAALRVRSRIASVVERIGTHPHSAQEVAQRRGVRRVPLGRYPYVIYYEIGAAEVTILRILHDARQQPWEDGR